MSDRGPGPRTEREWGCAPTSGKGRCEALLLSALLSAKGSVGDERHVSSDEGQRGPGESNSTLMATFQQGMERATDTGGMA